MSAPEHRGPHTRSSSGTGSTAWLISSDPGRRPARPDLLAGLLTVVGGGAALLQLFLSWSSMVPGVGLRDANGGVTGWERYLAARAGAALSISDTVTAYSVLGTALAGGALVLLGLAMFLPIDHHPLGLVAVVLSVGVLASAGWWLTRGHQSFNQSVAELFSQAGPGWYLFLIAGPIAIVGAVKGLVAG
ncbi:MAG: hypothetical protein ACR2M5_06710 [Nakamurella sp.]